MGSNIFKTSKSELLIQDFIGTKVMMELVLTKLPNRISENLQC